MDFKIAVLAGDGIGPEISTVGVDVMTAVCEKFGHKVNYEYAICGADAIDKVGDPFPEATYEACKNADAVLFSAVGDPKFDNDPTAKVRPEQGLLAMRKKLGLFANIRPVQIDWVFFRENTEGAYAVGSQGVNVSDDLAIDFTVTTTQGTERICKLAFEYAKKTGRTRVTAVTKANVIKTTDGKFLSICKEIAAQYPNISFDDWYIDIMTAKLVDEKRRTAFQVMVLPNLYGDILTDEAAEFQGGVGTAGSANIGKRYAMFEAIHGSAPRMVQENRAQYADPCSVLRACVMLLEHIGKAEKASHLSKALDHCMFEEPKFAITGRADGATAAQFTEYLMETIQEMQ